MTTITKLTALNKGNPANSNGENIQDSVNELIDITVAVANAGGGNLTPTRPNELRDGGTYFLPPANSVDENEYITISLPDAFASFQPLVKRSGLDSIVDSNGPDTEILFDTGTSIEIILTSDGVSIWRL